MKMNRRLPMTIVLLNVALAVLILAACSPAGHSLKPDEISYAGDVSYAAEIAAGLRAIAAMEPDEKIKNPDYLAEKLLTPNFWFFGPLMKDYKKSKQFIKFYRVGGYYAINAMTHHIDGILRQSFTKNLKQVVIIGSGFDSRAYRLGQEMPDVRFFELDQPGTLKRKKQMVRAALGKIPKKVTYIPIDYRTLTIFDALKQAGYDQNQKTLFIWEDTARYTDRQVVDDTMRFIAEHSAAGSEMIFNYIFDEVVQGDYSKYRRARFTSLRMETSGEIWKFGIAEGKAEEFVTQRGLKVISDLGAKELAQRYLVRSDGSLDGKPTAYVRIMHAAVAR